MYDSQRFFEYNDIVVDFLLNLVYKQVYRIVYPLIIDYWKNKNWE